MPVPSTSWSESSPAGSDLMSTVDNRIREMKVQVREVVGVDHDFPSSGQANDVGQHLRVTLQEQADLGSGVVGTTILGSQTVSGKGELVYTDEDDNDVQITDNGKINAESIDGVYPCSTAAKAINILNFIYPVGSLYFNASVTTNPGTLLGFGTWVAFGAGRVPVGIDAGQTEFDTLEETGGSKTNSHTHTHSHTHIVGRTGGVEQPGGRISMNDYQLTTDGPNTSTTSTPSDTSILQPYIVVAIWKRTA